MMKDSELKLVDIKQYNPILHQYVLDKKIKLQDAYNLARSGIEMVSEYKGRGSKNMNLPPLNKMFDNMMKAHKPSIEELLDEIKNQFQFTFDSKVKDYLEK
jgi:hypothetical protein